MKKACFLFALTVAELLCGKSESFGSVGSEIAGSGACGSGGTLYRNLTSHPMHFELLLSVGLIVLNGCSSTSLAWTDAQGHSQTLTVKYGFSAVVSTSLPAEGVISWSTIPTSGFAPVFSWELQRGEAASLGSLFAPSPVASPCGTGSSVYYTNLSGRPVELDVATQGGQVCQGTFSWTDARGHSQTLSGGLLSEGVSTSLPAGGTISFAGNGSGLVFSTIERVPLISALLER
ncbi:MAG TPA: hypothetical protein VGW33_06745 [Terriglobia bacterium]|nr:hypothetical protein [Terriglobia bacterium]